jgi:rubrerythrin
MCSYPVVKPNWWEDIAVSFDIERYKSNSKKLDLSDIRWDLVREHELPRGAIDSMFYMMDIETHTVIYLSELLVSKACMDPVITSFLSCWVYEEMYHGEAFVRFLRAYGLEVADDRPQQVRLHEGFKRVNAVMAIMFGSYLVPFFPALYLTIGAVNELTTLTGYRQLQKRARHPVLNEILERIIKQERTHYAFYRSQAEKFLRASAAARGATRWFLQTRFKVVGEGVKTVDEVNQLALDLFDGPDGREAVRDIDRQVRQLPGMAGLNVMERCLDRAYTMTGAPQLASTVTEAAVELKVSA